jgi:hypothetical protein
MILKCKLLRVLAERTFQLLMAGLAISYDELA